MSIFTKALTKKMHNFARQIERKTAKSGISASLCRRAKFYARQQQGIVLKVDHVGLFDRRLGVTGWALSRKGAADVRQISISLNGHILGNASLGDARVDVAQAYSFIADSECAGFHFYTDLPEALVPVNPQARLSICVTGLNGKRHEQGHALQNDYYAWILRNEPTEDELAAQKTASLLNPPLVSIVTPIYNTPEKFLVDMLESVSAQTYSNWELCLTDGGSRREHVKKILAHYAEQDSRIKVNFLPENLGIAGNSNAALEQASGEWVALLDHDDTLAPFALFEAIEHINRHPGTDYLYSDEDRLSEDGTMRYEPHFKPDWSPDTLRSTNYPTHLSVFRKTLLERIGGFRTGFDGSQDYDLILRATEQAGEVGHIPKILYHWRMHDNSLARNSHSKTYAYDAAQRALREHLGRVGLEGTIETTPMLGYYKVTYTLKTTPLISIIIPNHEHADDLKRCVNSILTKSSYSNFEILIVENGSRQRSTFTLYEKLRTRPNIRILEWQQEPFNYSAINNFAAGQAQGEVLLFLNNDTEVISADWLERMLEHAIRPEVGVVGAKLYYPDRTIQHAGIVLGLYGSAAHGHKGFSGHAAGYMGRLQTIQNVSAVTAACAMVRTGVFQKAGGFDEKYRLAFNDVDLCLNIKQSDYLIVWTPYAELYHHESKTRGLERGHQKRNRFQQETTYFQKKWAHALVHGDPCYNSNLTLNREDFSLKSS